MEQNEKLLKIESVQAKMETLCQTDAPFKGFLCDFAGTTKIENLNSNIGSLGVTLSEEDIKEVSDLISIKEVAGDRTTDYYLRCSWKFANTPPKDGKTPS